MRLRGGCKRTTLGAIDEVPRAWFASLARKFIDINRRHLVTQEERFHALRESILELERAGGKSRQAE